MEDIVMADYDVYDGGGNYVGSFREGGGDGTPPKKFSLFYVFVSLIMGAIFWLVFVILEYLFLGKFLESIPYKYYCIQSGVAYIICFILSYWIMLRATSGPMSRFSTS
jgi:hypothetical protein